MQVAVQGKLPVTQTQLRLVEVLDSFLWVDNEASDGDAMLKDQSEQFQLLDFLWFGSAVLILGVNFAFFVYCGLVALTLLNLTYVVRVQSYKSGI